MIDKHKGKLLYAIFKNEIHQGNSYGFDKNDAVISHLKRAQFPVDKNTINDYEVVEAIENLHYFKSKYVTMPERTN